jgi:uncharacterized protein (TIGR02996 family)
MSALTALLRECVENREDDAPRLVLADWLDDDGQHERAEFVRLQLALARSEPLSALRSLWLQDNPIGEEAESALRRRFGEGVRLG